MSFIQKLTLNESESPANRPGEFSYEESIQIFLKYIDELMSSFLKEGHLFSQLCTKNLRPLNPFHLRVINISFILVISIQNQARIEEMITTETCRDI